MSNEVISDNGKDRVVREDTAKAFRWSRFIGIILVGIILILVIFVLFFSGALMATKPNLNPTNTSNQNSNPGP